MDEYFYGSRSDELGQGQPQPQLPEPEADPRVEASTTGGGGGGGDGGVSSYRGGRLQRRQSAPFLNAAVSTTTGGSRLRKASSALNAAAAISGRKMPSLNAATSASGTRQGRHGVGKSEERKEAVGSDDDFDFDDDDVSSSDTDWSGDDVEGGGLCRRRRRRPPDRAFSRLSPVAECREQSTSAWLHFPHVELVVLFYAFEGAVASQVSALREGGCPSVMITAAVALVSGKIRGACCRRVCRRRMGFFVRLEERLSRRRIMGLL